MRTPDAGVIEQVGHPVLKLVHHCSSNDETKLHFVGPLRSAFRSSATFLVQLTAKQGDTVTPGTKVAILAKGKGGGAPAQKQAPKPEAPAKKQEASSPPKPKPLAAEAPPPPRPRPAESAAPGPSRASISEPQLPPKDRERRVSVVFFSSRRS